ncbi:MAG: phage tail tape measure protein [Methanomassiliicoccus sp.]|nr:phage tail tape measure protein [Methanomassiliicoccus sp.]
MAGNLGDINVNVTANTADFTRGMATVQKEADNLATRLSSSFKAIGSTMSNVGRSMTAGVTLPLAAVGAASLLAYKDFDEAMSKIQAVTGMAADQISDLGDAARQMSRDSTFSSTEVADAMYWLADSTSTAAEIQEYLAGAMDYSTAAGTDLADTAQDLQTTMKAFNIDASRSGEVADNLTAAFQNSMWTAEEFNTAITYVSSSARLSGMSIGETAAALDVMSRAGYDASTAGAALRMGLTKLQTPSDALTKTMAKYGLTMDDVNPKVAGLEGALRNLRNANIDAGDAAKIFSVEAMGPMMSLISSSDGDFATLIQNMKDSGGAAAEAADIMANSAAGKMKIMQDKLQDIAITLGEKLFPIFEDLVNNYLMPALDWFSNLSEGTQGWIVKIGLLAAAIGPLLMMLGPMVSGLGSVMGIVGGLGGGGSILGGLSGLLGGGGAAAGGAAAGGIGLAGAAAVAAPVAAIGGIAAWAAIRDFDVDAMGQDIKGVTDFLGGIGQKIGDAINSVDWTELTNKILAFGPKVVDAIAKWLGGIDWGQLAKDLGSFADGIVSGIANWFNSIDWLGGMSDSLGSTSDLINGVINWFKNIDWGGMFSNLGAEAGKLVNGFVKWVSEIDWGQVGKEFGTGLRKLIEDLVNWVMSIDWWGVIQGIGNGIIGAIQGVVSFLATIDWWGLVVAIGNTVLGILEGIGGFIIGLFNLDGMYNTLAGGVTSLVDTAVSWITGFVNGLAGGISSLLGGAASWVLNFITGLGNGALQLITSAAIWVLNFVTGIGGGIGQLIGQAAQWVSNFVSGIAGGIIQLVSQAAAWVLNFITGIAGGVSQLISGALAWVTNFVTGIAGGVGKLISGAAEWVTNFINGIAGGVSKLVSGAADWVTNFVDGIAGGVDDLVSGAAEWISNFVNGITGGLGEIWDIGAKIIDQVVSGITGGIGKVGDAIGKAVGDLVPDGEWIPGFKLYAKGGYADKPTLGIFGEAGPEWIVPDGIMQSILDLRSQIISSAPMASIMSNLGQSMGLSATVPVGINPAGLSKTVYVGQIVMQMGTPNNVRSFMKDFRSELKLMGI